jgi:hypothetical protein
LSKYDEKDDAGGDDCVLFFTKSIISILCFVLLNSLFLLAPFTIDEFREALFSMKPDKCPGLDGFNPGFYQHFWPLCGQQIFQECCSWLSTGTFPSTLNLTKIALIPKWD